MRLPEQRLYDWLARKIAPVAMLERVENRVKKDTPDLYLSTTHGQALRPRPLQGWIELKSLDAFPVRATTAVRLPNWTNGQRYWALRHRSSGGWTWLVVQVGQEVFVFDAAELATNDWSQTEWRSFGQRLNKRGCSASAVLDALSAAVV
jgi:hypothetical protein